MERRRSRAKSGLVKGRLVSRSWTYYRSATSVPLAGTVEAADGRPIAKDQVGFPLVVSLDCEAGLLPEAGRIRLMKAFALAHDAARGARAMHGGPRIEMRADTAATGNPSIRTTPGVIEVTVPSSWASARVGSLAALRAEPLLLMEARPACPGGRGEGPPASSPSRRPHGPPSVLMFRNIFTKDVQTGDARQINPGVHYLASSLIRSGARLVLLDGKIPLQDVCQRPPDVNDRLAIRDCLTDPEELDRALGANPDLDLVCLTLLERSFAQVREIARFVRERSGAFIAIGGVFPTVSPEHCFAHMAEANVIVRGDGEEILPRIAGALAGLGPARELDVEAVGALESLEGVIARTGTYVLSSRIDKVNRVPDLDRSILDYSFFQRSNVDSGLSLSTSRGCIYSCRFCSVMDKKLWRGRSASAVMRDLRAYGKRLEEIYGSKEAIPRTAMNLQIWDDDFFMDRPRAIRLLGSMTRAGFTTTFVQGTVSSFFRKKGRRISSDLDERLIEAIPLEFFTGVGGVKIGTESFCDRELRRLGKPYDTDRIRKLAIGLGRRGIRQDHYMILCNRSTSLEDLLEGFETIAGLRWTAGTGFSVLEPSWLINLFPTALYRACVMAGTERDQPTAGILSVEGYPEVDYPFVLPGRPERDEVFEVVRRFPAGMHFGAAGEVEDAFTGVFGPGDRTYTRVFREVKKVLERRLEAIAGDPSPEARSERLRIEEAMLRHLAGDDWVPCGLLRVLAPRIASPPDPLAASGQLAGYLESMLGSATDLSPACWDLEPLPEGVELRVESDGIRIVLLVQHADRDRPSAFRTRNLSFVVRSEAHEGEARDRESRVLEHWKGILSRHDQGDLS